MSMNQELIQQETAGGNGGGTTSYATGSLCPKTGLWKTFDGKIEVIEYYMAEDAYDSGG